MKTDAEILMEYARAIIAAKQAREVFVSAFIDNCNKQEVFEPQYFDFVKVLSSTGRETAFIATLAEWNKHKLANKELGKAKRAVLIRGKLLLKGETR